MDKEYKGPAVLRPDLIHEASERRVVELLAENEKLKAQLDRALEVVMQNAEQPGKCAVSMNRDYCAEQNHLCLPCRKKYIMEGNDE
jgi:hypothetical protein